MQTIRIKYDPYKMETTMSINDTDIRNIPSYANLRKLFDTHTPLQTWIEPIKYKNWNGLINELVSENDYDKLEIFFSGRVIDYQDLKRACEAQNQERAEDFRLSIKYHHPEIISDKKLSENIDAVVQQLLSSEFQALVEARGQNSQVYKDYQRLAGDYEFTKNREFKIVFAGLFSSGKSTILNSLIKRDVLPTSTNTCTAKTCKIKHDSSLNGCVSLTCYDAEGEIVVPTERYESDDDCRKRFWEITPLGATVSNPENVEVIEIGVDLSHLYPTEDMKKRFSIVIVDTPGCNSSKTKGQNIKQDISIALDAITDGAKEMVIICADSQDYEDESLGTFLKAINDTSKEDSGDFNDRFLFVLNKCDALSYQEEIGESITQKRDAFYKYLTDPSRWGFGDADTSPDFVPKVMMMTARAYEAVRTGIYAMEKKEALKNSRAKPVYQDYNKFKENVIDCEDENYYLARYCDIPKYRLLELEQRFKNCLNEGNESEAVSIQSGVECVEIAIRDYIERYAYPFKVRDLMETFDALLQDITEFVNYETQAYEKAREALGKTISAGEEAEKQKKEQEIEESRLQSINAKIEEQKERISSINYTHGEVHQISADFDSAVENSPTISQMRARTGMITAKELNQCIKDIYSVITPQWEVAQKKFDAHTSIYKTKLAEIKAELQTIRTALSVENEDPIFKSLSSGKHIDGFSEESFRAAAALTKKTETVRVQKGTKTNPIKNEKYKWWQFGKKIKQFFAEDEVPNYVNVEQDKYEIAALLIKLTEITTEFAKLCEQTELEFLEDIATAKMVALQYADDVSDDLSAITEKLKTLRETIISLKSNLPELEAKQKESQKTLKWLQNLKEIIDKRGVDNV